METRGNAFCFQQYIIGTELKSISIYEYCIFGTTPTSLLYVQVFFSVASIRRKIFCSIQSLSLSIIVFSDLSQTDIRDKISYKCVKQKGSSCLIRRQTPIYTKCLSKIMAHLMTFAFTKSSLYGQLWARVLTNVLSRVSCPGQ